MSKSKHTPGPWYWEGAYDRKQFNIYSGNPDWKHIATVNNIPNALLQLRDSVRSEANARLIAEAPAMLEALRDLLHADFGDFPARKAEAKRTARAILARIDGEA